jgi:hypothetical protein
LRFHPRLQEGSDEKPYFDESVSCHRGQILCWDIGGGGPERVTLITIDRPIESPAESLAALDTLNIDICASRAEMLSTVENLDRAESWKANGAASMKQWLAARFGIAQRTAAEWVRVAHKLAELPHVRAAYAAGMMSWDQLSAVTRIADETDDADWARRGPTMTVSDIRRRARKASASASEAAHRGRYLHYWRDADNPIFHIRGQLPDAQGAIVARALDLFAHDRLPDPRYKDDQHGIYEDYESRTAGSLVQIASQALGGENDADRATVVVHVTAASLAAATGQGEVEDGPTLPAEILRRFACDARIQPALVNQDGHVVGIGRTSRSIPSWLSRQIKIRDAHCRFPGCERRRWVHRHHLRHRADGGCTDLCNLITLCGFHHRLIHEGGWSIVGDPNGEVTWVRPDGTAFDPRPYPRSHIASRIAASRAGRWLPERIQRADHDDTS